MKPKIYAIYDSKTEVWSQPMCFLNRGTAVRAWESIANDNETQMCRHPADFTMFEIGEYDDSTAEVLSYATKTSLGLALEMKKQNNTLPMFPNKPEALQEASSS